MDKKGTKQSPSGKINEILEIISRDRTRTNLLPGSISYSAMLAVLTLFSINVAYTAELLRIADTRR